MVQFVEIVVGDSVTSYQELIRFDNADYDLCIETIDNPSLNTLRCIAELLACNYLVTKGKLQNKFILTKKAIAICNIV